MISEVDQLGRMEEELSAKGRTARFEQALLPHLRAAYNLARWLTGNHHDAEDLVQEAYLRAFKAFDGFRGGEGRAWLLAIVRNTAYTRFEQNRSSELNTVFDEEIHSPEGDAGNPEISLIQSADTQQVREAIEELPLQFREVLILREMEGLSYHQIAETAHVPLGTVMSRLARARERLREGLHNRMNGRPSSAPPE